MSANKESGTSKDPPPEVKEFEKELHSLFDHSRTASASKIDRLTKLAFKAARYYKNIVYCLEKFITRCVPEYKLTGLYVLDSICRTSQSAKTKLGSSGGGTFTGSEYVARFEKNIEALFVEFTKVMEDKEKEKVKRVVEIWERSGTFAAKTTENIKKKYFPLLETEISRAAAAAEQEAAAAAALAEAEAAKVPEESSADKAASFITSLAASLAASNSPAASVVSSSNSKPSTSPTTTGPSYTPSLHYPMGNTYTATSTSTPVNPLLSGISDPSSALALQTLLATVSQVKAAAAAGAAAPAPAPAPVSAMPPVPGHHYSGYPSAAAAAAPMLMPDYGTTAQGTSSLPPVLQQLQGMLSNSNQQQNLGFAPNNNSVVTSSTAPLPPPSTTAATTGASSVMSAMSASVIDPRAGGRGAMSSSLPGFSGGVSIGTMPNGAPGGMPRDPRAAPADPRASQQQQQPMPVDPRANPRLGMMGTQSLGGTAQPPFQAQSLFQGQGPLHLGSLLDGQGAAMLMRNAVPGDVGAKGNMGGVNKSGGAAGLDGHAMAQLASFMNGIQQKEGAAPHQLQQTGPGTRGENGGQGRSQPRPGAGVNGSQGGYSLPRRGGMEEKGNNSHHRHGPNGPPAGHGQGYGVKDDPSIGPDQIRVISRTLWVGGSFIPSMSEQELEGIFAPLGKIATLMINQAKFNAFIKMTDRTDAERCKAELGGTLVQGDIMKVNWGCGFGPRDCFDYTTGTGVIPLERLTDTDRRWLANSVVGGFGPGEVIRGGVSVMEPNIEPVGRDGREALPRRGGLGGSGGGGGHHAGGLGGGGRGRGRGRGRGGEMDHDDFGVGRGRGRGGIHILPPPPQVPMGANGPSSSQHQHQHQLQHQLPPTPQPRVHPLPHRPQVSVAGAATVKRDFGGGDSGPTAAAVSGGAATGQGDDTRRNKKSRWE
ncbi:hypothetical protein BG015_006939 [Linnemannia schmuckeri]|uniref:CID domain-containing protein n=1 Tax=Linnemannia schmuckeri TaxID=64567 RepID=A0A9P5S2S9_9FUNG|nr:hypothetical protein BG015_006939 [Linnemannia schmuckeri]